MGGEVAGLTRCLACGAEALQAGIGAVPGASRYFLGGVTAYALAQKTALLGVDAAEVAATNGVSAAVAAAMARGVCARFGSDVGVATTGYAEPSPADGVAEPFAWWAVVRTNRNGRAVAQRSGRVECPGASRIEAQTWVAEAALAALAEFLRGQRGGATAPRR